MTDMDALVLWLREQIALKRRRAMATAFTPDGPAATWTYDREHNRVVIREQDHTVGVASRRAGVAPDGTGYFDVLLDIDGEHMELNDPRAAIAECDAHTAVLDLHLLDSGGTELCNDCRDPYPCSTVRALGLAHQHRPGYREDWRP